MDDYFESTVATFHALTDVLDSPAEVDAAWERLKREHPEWEHHKSPKSESEYLIDRENGDIYRKSHHWGRVASCNWKISLVNQGAYAIGKANVRDFERKQGYLDLAETAKQYEQRQYIRTVNRKFNEELQKQIDGTLPKGHVYDMGMPGEILLSTGIANVPIQLSATKLKDKSTHFGHDYDLSEIRDLVKAINNPVAIFVYGDKEKGQNIIVEIQHGGKNFVVGLSIRPSVGGEVLEINNIRNVFPKDNAEWLNWINQGKLLYADKKKIQALIDQQRTNLADVDYLDLDSVAKIIKDFKNPVIAGENNLAEDADIRFRQYDKE